MASREADYSSSGTWQIDSSWVENQKEKLVPDQIEYFNIFSSPSSARAEKRKKLHHKNAI